MDDRQVLARWAPAEWEASRGKGEPSFAGLTVEAKAVWLRECEKTLSRIRAVEIALERPKTVTLPGQIDIEEEIACTRRSR